jgi:Protein of unknown function (DUF1573)
MIDFGPIKEGETVHGRFAFSNLSNTPLEIEIVSACECITPEWTGGSIEPGKTGEILVAFNSKDQEKEVFKTIDVIFKNSDAQGYPLVKQLYLKGKIF